MFLRVTNYTMKRLIYLTGLILIYSYNVLSQIPMNFCGQVFKESFTINKISTLNYDISSSGGIHLPSKGYIRALAIFVQFKDDFQEDNNWKLNEIPKWADQLSSLITNYFTIMSDSALKLEIDVYPKVVVTDRTQMDYYYDKQNYGAVNKEVLLKVDQDISFLPYDNWVQEDKYKIYPGQDNQVDLVFMIYRRLTVLDILKFYGVSDLGFGWKLPVDNTKRYLWGGNETDHDDASSSGLTVALAGSGSVMDLNSAYRLIVHETLHKLYGEGHPVYNFALLGVLSNSYGSLGMSSFEKAMLGYLKYKRIDSLKTMEIALHDYMTTGEAYLIPVPNLPDQFYILENRQKISPFDEVKYPGLYIYHLKYNNQYSRLDIQTADGKWDWTLDERKNVIKAKENPISGNSHLEIVKIGNDYYYPPEMEGNKNDPFTISNKDLYAPWTNPTSNGKWSGYQDYPTNVYIKIIEEKDGVIKIKLSFNASLLNVNKNDIIADKYCLFQNYPNPFNSSTKINFSIPKSTFIEIKVFDILGREVKTLVNDFKESGAYTIDFDAKGLPGGVYFVSMKADDYKSIKKIVYLK